MLPFFNDFSNSLTMSEKNKEKCPFNKYKIKVKITTSVAFPILL